MALDIRDGNNAPQVLKATDSGGELIPHHFVDNDFALDATLQDVSNSTVGYATTVTGTERLLLIGAVRRDDQSPIADDGESTPLITNSEGRLKVSTRPAMYDLVTGNITATQAAANGAQTAAAQVTCDVSGASNVMMHCVGTFSTVNCTFEGSIDSTNWFTIQAVRSNANTIETTTGNLSAAPAYAWELSVNGLTTVRVRCTARTSGTQTWNILRGSFATEPIPAAQASATQTVSGSVTATSNIGTSGMTIYTDTVANLGISASYTGTSRDLGATPAYNRFVVNAVSDQAGTFRIEKSTDNSTWRRATSEIAVVANEGKEYSIFNTTRYVRVVYTNGGVAQTLFSLTSAIHRI